MGILADFIRWLPGYFFPKVCYGCEKEGAYVCDDCRKTVEGVLDNPRCPECGKEATFGATHPGCRRRWGLDGLIGYYKYAGWTKEIVKEAKFGKHHRYAAMKELTVEMAKAISPSQLSVLGFQLSAYGQSVFSQSVKTDKPITDEPITENRKQKTDNRNLAVVPVPLHWWREFKRGFNQAELIAKEFSEAWKIPMVKILTRREYTEPQTLTEKEVKLTKDQEEELEKKYKSSLQLIDAKKRLLNKLKAKRRRENIKGAFKINSVFSIQYSELINVLLVDDVWTTGATVKECCRVLKKAGAKKVWGITLLRA